MSYQILKNACRKSLMLTVLLLSVLSFSGTAVSDQTKQAATQGEWVLKLKAGQVKSVSYKQAYSWFNTAVLTGPFCDNGILNLSYLHTEQAKTRMVLHSPIAILGMLPCFYLGLKTIPTESDSDPILILS